MKKAKANKTVSVNGTIWVRGTMFEPPYPPGIQAEIDACQGKPDPTITEFEIPDPVVPETPEPPLENPEPTLENPDPPKAPEAMISVEGDASSVDSADRRKQLIAFAKEKFGVKIDGRKNLEDIEAQVGTLEAKAAEEETGDSESSEDSELNTI